MKEKCFIIDDKSEYITKYGTDLNPQNPSVVYIRSKIKVTPKVKQPSFETEIKQFKEELKKYIINEINDNKFLEDKHLCSIELSPKSVTYKKISYMRLDIYVKPLILKPLVENQPIITELSSKVKNKVFQLLDKYNLKCSTQK